MQVQVGRICWLGIVRFTHTPSPTHRPPLWFALSCCIESLGGPLGSSVLILLSLRLLCPGSERSEPHTAEDGGLEAEKAEEQRGASRRGPLCCERSKRPAGGATSTNCQRLLFRGHRSHLQMVIQPKDKHLPGLTDLLTCGFYLPVGCLTKFLRISLT